MKKKGLSKRAMVLLISLCFSGMTLLSEESSPHPKHEIENMTLENSLRSVHKVNIKKPYNLF